MFKYKQTHSEVGVGFVESHVVSGVDHVITSINIVSLHDHLKDLRLVNSSFLHEVNDLILNHHSVIDVVFKLYLDFVLKLSVLLQDLLIFNRVSEILIIFSQQVHFAVVSPRVESISKRILCPNSDVLATLEKQKSVEFLVKTLPVHHMGHPREAVDGVED